MFCPNASASADAGCCVNKHSSGEGIISYRPNYQAAQGSKKNMRKENTFFLVGEQKEDETPDQGSHRSKMALCSKHETI